MIDRKITISLHSRPLPQATRAAIQKTGDDDFIICLNSEMTDDEQAAGLLHDVLHIWHRDFDSLQPADRIEHDRHAELLRILTILGQEAQQE